MTTQPEALRLANALEKYWGAERGHDRERQAAAELRRLHAVNDSDTALLRQAWEALEKMLDDAKHECVTVTHWNDCVDTITALRERLGEKT